MDDKSKDILNLYISGVMELSDVIAKEISYIKTTFSSNRNDNYPLNDNKFGIASVLKMKLACSAIVTMRLMELMFEANENEAVSYEDYKEKHRRLFSDIYPWAGEERTIKLEKRLEYLNGRTIFFLEDEINTNMNYIFTEIHSMTNEITLDRTMQNVFKRLDRDDWTFMDNIEKCAICAKIMGRMWYTHPFIEGNTIMGLWTILTIANNNGFPISTKVLREQHDKIDLRKCILLASLPEDYDVNYLANVFLLAIKSNEINELEEKKKTFSKRTMEEFLKIAADEQKNYEEENEED